jgi:hypothetical protein
VLHNPTISLQKGRKKGRKEGRKERKKERRIEHEGNENIEKAARARRDLK